MEAIWYLGPTSPRRPSESCPTFHAGLCVASIFHTSDNAPQPCAATLIFVVYCSRLRDSARHSKLCISVISTGSILACTADRQPNTEVMNKSQYSITEPGGGLFIWCISGNLGWILNQTQWPASRCIIQSRFKNHCWHCDCHSFHKCYRQGKAQNRAKYVNSLM